MTLSIRRAQPADAGELARFAARTFFDTYADANDPADMAAHLSDKYSEAIQAAEIRNPRAIYLIAELDGGLAGYAYLLREHGPEGATLDGPVQLVRFYVAREWHGRGVAQVLMDACVDQARRSGGQTLWLTVWQQNARAIAFYRKAGFNIAGTVHFKLGSQLQEDHLMTLALDPVGSGEPIPLR